MRTCAAPASPWRPPPGGRPRWRERPLGRAAQRWRAAAQARRLRSTAAPARDRLRGCAHRLRHPRRRCRPTASLRHHGGHRRLRRPRGVVPRRLRGGAERAETWSHEPLSAAAQRAAGRQAPGAVRAQASRRFRAARCGARRLVGARSATPVGPLSEPSKGAGSVTRPARARLRADAPAVDAGGGGARARNAGASSAGVRSSRVIMVRWRPPPATRIPRLRALWCVAGVLPIAALSQPSHVRSARSARRWRS